MYYGMQAARGDFIILLDADLQNDPMDAPLLWRKLLDEKLDMVTGVRKNRNDTWVRRISSRIANRVRGALFAGSHQRHRMHVEGRAARSGAAVAGLDRHAPVHARADLLSGYRIMLRLFQLHTYWSILGIGVVLTQRVDDGEKYVVAFVS